MRAVSRILLVLSILLLAAAPASARCNYLTPGCAEWYLDNNATYHSIRSDWRGIQGRGVRFADTVYRHRHYSRHSAAQ